MAEETHHLRSAKRLRPDVKQHLAVRRQCTNRRQMITRQRDPQERRLATRVSATSFIQGTGRMFLRHSRSCARGSMASFMTPSRSSYHEALVQLPLDQGT